MLLLLRRTHPCSIRLLHLRRLLSMVGFARLSYYIRVFLHCCVVAAQPQLRLIRTCTVSFLRQAQLRLIRTCCLVSSYTAYSIATAAHPHLLSRLLLRSIASAAHPHLCVLSHLRHVRIFAFYRTCGTTASLRTIAPAAHPHLCVYYRNCGTSAPLRLIARAAHSPFAFPCELCIELSLLRLVRTFSIKHLIKYSLGDVLYHTCGCPHHG